MKIYNECNSKHPDFLTVEEAAEFLGVTKQTIYNYIQRKTLEAYKLGSKAIRIDRNDLNKLIIKM